MYSRHRVAGYSIDHVIKFLFFLLVPVVILDIMISCFVIFFHAFPKYSVPARYNIPLCFANRHRTYFHQSLFNPAPD